MTGQVRGDGNKTENISGNENPWETLHFTSPEVLGVCSVIFMAALPASSSCLAVLSFKTEELQIKHEWIDFTVWIEV